jgi:small subunit ribosomal protein S13
VARLSGVDLPREKSVLIGLTYIYGIGMHLSKIILQKANVEQVVKVKDLAEDDIVKIREVLKDYLIEGDLRRRVSQDIKRLMDINCYRGLRHRRKLPVRGQRTKTNARTKRGRRQTIANKKKVTK